MNILVSACLLGINTKYNGESNKNLELYSIMNKYNLIPVCPEQLGGMSTPRLPSEILGGKAQNVLKGEAKVVNLKGEDVTYNFMKGSQETLNIAKIYGCRTAILKSKSPSCGYGSIYDGTFTGKLIQGNGICAEILSKNGINVFTENNLEYFLRYNKI